MKLCVVKTDTLGPSQRDINLLEIGREFECELEGDKIKIDLEKLKLAIEIVRWSFGSSLVLMEDNKILRGIYQQNFPNTRKENND